MTDGDVASSMVQFDSTGRSVSYLANQDDLEIGEAFQVDLKTGAVFQINAPLVTGGDVYFFIVVGGTPPLFS